jgi:hypothetical protein
VKSLLDRLRCDDDDGPKLPDSTPDSIALAAAEVEAEAEAGVGLGVVATCEDRERCLAFAWHLGALRLVLGQLELAYRTRI